MLHIKILKHYAANTWHIYHISRKLEQAVQCYVTCRHHLSIYQKSHLLKRSHCSEQWMVHAHPPYFQNELSTDAWCTCATIQLCIPPTMGKSSIKSNLDIFGLQAYNVPIVLFLTMVLKYRRFWLHIFHTEVTGLGPINGCNRSLNLSIIHESTWERWCMESAVHS